MKIVQYTKETNLYLDNFVLFVPFVVTFEGSASGQEIV